jgi:hypothetical protein
MWGPPRQHIDKADLAVGSLLCIHGAVDAEHAMPLRAISCDPSRFLCRIRPTRCLLREEPTTSKSATDTYDYEQRVENIPQS